MREMYDDCPVIYRWVPHVTSFGDMETYYIGQTSWLTQRIEDYRQTNGLPNNRLRKQFLGYARRGIKVGLEILAHCSGLPDGLVMEDVLVEDRRLIIESVLIDFYRDQGFTMLNCTY